MPTATPSSGATLAGPLKLGSRGKDVQTLQSLLNKATFPGPGLSEDGTFGIKTDAAVRAFQQRNGLKADGIVGPLTAQALGVKFVPQPQPLPKLDPPGTPAPPATLGPQAALLRVIVSQMKAVFKNLDDDMDGLGEDFNDAENLARKFFRSSLNQGLFILSTALPDGLGAAFVANQTRAALMIMFGGMAGGAGALARAGADASDVMSIMTEFNATIPQVVDTVRDALNGQIDGGIRAAVSLIRDLLDPLTR